MKEAYVSFEVAKLLKEKGFDRKCNHYYMEKVSGDEHYLIPGSIMFNENYNERIKLNELGVNINTSSGKISTPTQQMACDWVEKTYGFFIEVSRHIDINGNYHYFYMILDKECKYASSGTHDNNYPSKYEAVEAALQYCLTNLI